MANPQVENGYTKIANELFENFIKVVRFLTCYEISMWLAILRKTYGFRKKDDWISLAQLEKITGIRQCNLSRTKKLLLEKNMIINLKKKFGIQKNYQLWNIPHEVTKHISPDIFNNISHEITKHISPDIFNISHQITTKERTKETLLKEKEDSRESSALSRKKPDSKPYFNFETKQWENIAEEKKSLWKEAYPACDIEVELKAMIAWLLENPEKKKIRYGRFIIGWLRRCQDKGGTKGSPQKLSESRWLKETKLEDA